MKRLKTRQKGKAVERNRKVAGFAKEKTIAPTLCSTEEEEGSQCLTTPLGSAKLDWKPLTTSN